MKRSFLDTWPVTTVVPTAEVQALCVQYWAHWVCNQSRRSPTEISDDYFTKGHGSKGTTLFYKYYGVGYPAPTLKRRGKQDPALMLLEHDFPGCLRVLVHPFWAAACIVETTDQLKLLIFYLKPEVRSLFLPKSSGRASVRKLMLKAGPPELSSKTERIQLSKKCAEYGGLDGLAGILAIARFSVGEAKSFFQKLADIAAHCLAHGFPDDREKDIPLRVEMTWLVVGAIYFCYNAQIIGPEKNKIAKDFVKHLKADADAKLATAVAKAIFSEP